MKRSVRSRIHARTSGRAARLWLLILCVAPAALRAETPDTRASSDRFHAADAQLTGFIAALLEDNPQLRAARTHWQAQELRVPQQRALPDLQLQMRYFAETPETRVGPQEAGLGIHQGLPWKGKRALQGQRAERLAGGAGWDVQVLEHDLVSELKRTYYDAAYYQEALAINFEERELLQQFEKTTLTRYSTGEGIQQSVMKVQTEISRLLDLEVALSQQLDTATRTIARLLGRPYDDLILPHIHLPEVDFRHDAGALAKGAEGRRPEVRAAMERIEADRLWSRRQALESRPDFRVGLEYIYVGDREDESGVRNPPEDNGQDVVALVAGINIPLQRQRIKAGVAQAQQSMRARQGSLQAVRDRIAYEVQEASLRLDSLRERVELYREVLIPQAEGSLASAESAYVTDRLGFLDLLDAERVLFQARRMMHRLVSDLWVAASDLERAAGRQFPEATGRGVTS
jgi:outer membrane protein TolC